MNVGEHRSDIQIDWIDHPCPVWYDDSCDDEPAEAWHARQSGERGHPMAYVYVDPSGDVPRLGASAGWSRRWHLFPISGYATNRILNNLFAAIADDVVAGNWGTVGRVVEETCGYRVLGSHDAWWGGRGAAVRHWEACLDYYWDIYRDAGEDFWAEAEEVAIQGYLEAADAELAQNPDPVRGWGWFEDFGPGTDRALESLLAQCQARVEAEAEAEDEAQAEAE